MAKVTPKWPVQADHRFLVTLVKLSLGDKVTPNPEDLDRVSRVFLRAGGSWGRVFEGSPSDIGLLKTVLKTAFKYGYLTKAPKWE